MTEETGGRYRTRLLDTEFLNTVERLVRRAKTAAPERRRSLARVPAVAAAVVEKLDRRKGAAPSRRDDALPVPSFPALEGLFHELFDRDDTQPLVILIDSSQSMLYDGSPDPNPSVLNKFDFARKIAAAAGYVGLARGSRVHVAGFAQYRGRRAPFLNGYQEADTLLGYLQGLRAGGNTNFTPALYDSISRAGAAGTCLVLSDFYDPNWQKGIRALVSSRLNTVLMHVLTPAELSPDLLAELRLVDTETGTSREFAPEPGLRERHRTAVDAFCRRLHQQADISGLSYLRVTTDIPFERLLLKTLSYGASLRG